MKSLFQLPPMLSRDHVMARLAKEIASLPMDSGWRIEVHEVKHKRSHQQNNYLWGGVYPAILERGGETLAGWTAEDLHEYLLGECFGWERLDGFGRKRVRPKRRSSALSKTEFMGFVDFIQRTMAKHGIVVPDPDPSYWERAA